MLNNFKQRVSINKIICDGKNFQIERLSDYRSYPQFLKYFNDLDFITDHHLIIGINFSYGWMPTIFKFRSENIEGNIKEAVKILNKTKQGEIPSSEELKLLKSLFNNSLVGTSKLLHFINPKKIAIWDSRVYRYITNQEEPYENRIGDCETFLEYLDFCKLITQQDLYNGIHMHIEKLVGYTMTKCRTVELIMYSNGQKPKK